MEKKKSAAKSRKRKPAETRVRILLDEDVPAPISDQLRDRGYTCEYVNEIREKRWPGQAKVSDDLVCEEVARIPSVLVTKNIRDYADGAFIEALVSRFGVSVIIIRIPKAERRKGQSRAAMFDIVHRHAHKFGRLHGGEPSIVSMTRTGFRQRTVKEILAERVVRESRHGTKGKAPKARKAPPSRRKAANPGPGQTTLR